MTASVPRGMAVFGSVFRISAKPWARAAESAAARLQFQLDLLNRTHHPWPFRKPFLRVALDGSILLAIENVHHSQAEADAGSLAWARQIARESDISDQEWEIALFQSHQVAPHEQ